MRKPMLTSDQLVRHMVDKGITFTITTKEDAKKHLSAHNNYFKLTSYRKNYTKITTGPNAGKYENLEFAHLRELARIDTEIRHLLLDMALDIEHFMKVMLISEVEKQLPKGEDGYNIISDYLFDVTNPDVETRASNASKRAGGFARKISQNKNNPYCKDLTEKYKSDMPVWAYVELISFKDLKDLIEYYADQTGWTLPIDLRSLDRVRQIRNACAHGNAIINDLNPKPNMRDKSVTPREITQFVANAGVSKETREKKLSNPRINQIVHLLYIYNQVVTSQHTREMRINELKRLINERIPENKLFFAKNDLLTSTYHFFKTIVSTIN